MYALGLSFAGYRAFTAVNAEAAIQLIGIERPDAVVTDLRLTGVDGWGLVRMLKQNPATREIPIIVLTGDNHPSIAATARRTDCAAVITKPCLPDELIQVLQRAWSTDKAVA